MGWRFVLAALGILALAGCGDTSNSRLPVACPRPGLIADGADLTRYRPGAVRDLTTLEWDGRLTGLSGGCSPGRNGRSIDVTLTPAFVVERGAGTEGRVVELPWFVAVVNAQDERILSRRSFLDRVNFARNETRVSVEGGAVTLNLPVSETRRANDYRILVSFELTEDELVQNRRRGPR
ncbi:hypothetical protein [Paracraurococcus ruber]|uniref:Lipoprotein n=1 Tax=Paracraurococcus ruber TaxID=77675 RepID=A0ABS1CXW2_9PROT|nr:hypothetical protein [Paracraurococcus ruber]MBK1659146.1 hypothetical protein [Paracraurococcus ruber]